MSGFDQIGTAVSFDAYFAIFLFVVFIAGIIRGFAGFGSALLAVPALAVFYGPAQAVVIEVLIEIPVSLSLLPAAMRDAERKTVLPMLGMFVLFVPLGALALRAIYPEPLKIGISLLVLVMVAVIAMQKRLVVFMSPGAVYLTGAVAGFLQGLTAIAGPLFATALLARGESAQRTRANLIAVSGGLIILSVASFAIVGLITRQIIVSAVLATPAMLLGVWAGSVMFKRLSHWNLRAFILAFLVVTAVATLVQAVW